MNQPKMGSPTGWNSLWRDGAVIVAGGSVLAYLVGSLYLDSYYARFGLPESEPGFDVAYTMEASVLPLLYPVFWVTMAAVACLAFSRNLIRPAGFNPFYPIPGAKAVAYVVGAWSIKLLIDVLNPKQGTAFLTWSLHGVIVTLGAIAAFAVVYLRALRGHRAGPPPVLSKSTGALLGILLLATTLGAGHLAFGEPDWPYSRWQSAFLAFGWFYFLFEAWRDNQKWKTQLATAGEWETPRASSLIKNADPAGTLLSTSVAVLLILLSAGLSGSGAASAILGGCEAGRTITFDPMPAALDANETYLFVLHQENRFYVVADNASAAATLVTEVPGMTAQLGVRPAVETC